MINFIKEQLLISKLKKSLREYTRPDRAFLKSTRTRFVALAGQRAGVTVRTKHPLLWKYATIAIVAALSMTSGMAVFADANNVSATHPLYNLKRMSEQVRIGLSSPPQQVELHKMFAQRRLEEVSELKNEQDDRPIPPGFQNRIDRLNKDFQDETDNGLDQTKNPQVKKEARQQFCQDILNTIQNRPQSNGLPSKMVDHIKIRCSETVKNQED